MAFVRRQYLFSHTVKASSTLDQVLVIPVNLEQLVHPPSNTSPIFIVEALKVQAYARTSLQKVPVKFTLLDNDRTRIVTNEPHRLSTPWAIPGSDENNPPRAYAIGTDEEPYVRSVKPGSFEERVVTCNALAFTMTGNQRVVDDLRRAAPLPKEWGLSATRCSMCQGSIAHLSGTRSNMIVPYCPNGHFCVPRPSEDPVAQSARRVLSLLNVVEKDGLDVVRSVNGLCESEGLQFDLTIGSLSKVGDQTVSVIPYKVIQFVMSLYTALGTEADNLITIDSKVPRLRLALESPCDEIGFVSGSLSLAILKGDTVLEAFTALSTITEADEAAPVVPMYLSADTDGYEVIKFCALNFKDVEKDQSLDRWHACRRWNTSPNSI